MKEIWKPVVGYEGLYEVSNLGKVKSLPRKYFNRNRYTKEQILSTWVDAYGYKRVKLTNKTDGKSTKIHRILCEAFLPNPENKPYINHKDGNKLNNSLENLEWCTPAENIQHAYDSGLMPRKYGEENPVSKLSYKDIEQIRILRKTRGYTYKELGEMFGVSSSQIGKIVNKRSWKGAKNDNRNAG